MVISRARKNFRILLAGILLLSLAFFLSVAGLYTAVRYKYVDRLEAAHMLMKIDVIQYQTKAMFVDHDEQYKITVQLLKNGFFSPVYSDAGFIMLKDLADRGQVNAQFLQGEMILRYSPRTPENKALAIEYYQRAADQGHIPSRDKLIDLQKIAQK